MLPNRVLLCVLLVCFYQAEGQVSIKNTRSFSPDSNLLFKDVANVLEIYPVGIKELRIISANSGDISPLYNNNFVEIWPVSVIPDIIKVYSGKKLLLERKFFVDTVSFPVFRLGNLQKDTATVSEILANQGIRFVSKNLYDFKLTVFAFHTSFVRPNLDTLSSKIVADGNRLNTEQRNMIKWLTHGSQIVFYDVLVGAPGMRLRHIGPFAIVVR